MQGRESPFLVVLKMEWKGGSSLLRQKPHKPNKKGVSFIIVSKIITVHDEVDNHLVLLPVNHRITKSITQMKKLHTVFGSRHDGPSPALVILLPSSAAQCGVPVMSLWYGGSSCQ